MSATPKHNYMEIYFIVFSKERDTTTRIIKMKRNHWAPANPRAAAFNLFVRQRIIS